MFVEQGINGALDIMSSNMHPGLGFYRSENIDGFSYWGHAGNVPHYQSNMVFDFNTGIGVFATANSTSAIAAIQAIPEALLRSAIAEKTGGALNLPAPAEVTPVELATEELEALTGTYYVIGSSEFGNAYVEDGSLYLYLTSAVGEALALQPLSDGSFVDAVNGLRIWFEEIDGETVVFFGEFKSLLAAVRLDQETFTAEEGFEKWAGIYHPVLEDNWVSTTPVITVGIDDAGFAYAISETIMGVNMISGLEKWEDNNYGGMAFGTDGEDVWFEMGGLRFVRE
jgi:hypothetical protein